MKKNGLTLILFLLLGLVAATIVSGLLEPVDAAAFFLRTIPVNWHPAADLKFIRYDFFIEIKLNILSLVGIAAAVWLYRKL
ncbi:DUF4321 domain-containing protein [Paenibacillus sp. YN15]|uniref:DUF4321 domain-containing protein n=1 Tax=Paenibacillus sp. YN15 TaxID=1742774 RepID=UPI000DCE4584|nr:DUF4321 domain-containing protein [Paenibacillus sp. YN15]RAV06377.1 DUF4321 domain-containing protein [Paenibacillus sp. YN15]